MKRSFIFFLLIPVISFSQNFTAQEIARYKGQAERVTIVRDQWDVPHIYGRTDADAVFGLLYAQCEENFSRVEKNYLEIMGRMSEVEGRAQLYQDLQMRLIYDSAAAIADYKKSPAWFQKLLNAFADGVNYYLYTHPKTIPLALKHFEPWFPLLYTDGSIAPTQTGGLTLADMRNLYKTDDASTSFTLPNHRDVETEPAGSNGFALAPSRTT
jgi:acyl-homoserine lactone acylase PvdQ